jgi:hypothetical protein
MPPSACPPWPTDITGQTAGERNEAAGSYTTTRDTIANRKDGRQIRPIDARWIHPVRHRRVHRVHLNFSSMASVIVSRRPGACRRGATANTQQPAPAPAMASNRPTRTRRPTPPPPVPSGTRAAAPTVSSWRHGAAAASSPSVGNYRVRGIIPRAGPPGGRIQDSIST